jgi:hypothetical protein
MILDGGEVICDGMPTQYGCPSRTQVKRRWTAEGMKPNGWLVDHATEDMAGTPTVPRFLLHFCPSCAVIVLSQDGAS